MTGTIERRQRRNTTAQQQKRISGMSCPVCNGFIPISMYQILESSIFCPSCGLRLDINKNASSKAIEALKKVEKAQKEAESK